MLCLKRHHLVLTLSLLALFAVPFLCLSGSVSAASSSISLNDKFPNQIIYDPYNNSLGFTPTYFSLTFSGNGSCTINNSVYNILVLNESLPYIPNSDCSYSVVSSFNSSQSILTSRYSSYNSFWGDVIITFYDYNPSVVQPCPECPPIPETPYGDILNKIYIAILAVSATALCIYFFYAFYNMFFGGIKR